MSNVSYEESIKAAADVLRQRVKITPKVAIVAGSGLGEAVEKITTVIERIPYAEIPYYPQATVAGHKGELVFGKIARDEILLFSGRKHIYEGESLARVVFPAFLLGELKVPRLILTNAAGGLNPAFNVGDLMLITEGINLTFKPFSLRDFPAYSRFYRLNLATVFSPSWRSRVLAQAKREGFF
ncbi:MAG: purine-nucleoside phosphorylase, partial [Candidatus Sumerlaeia bacterium]|nr:purine-nucleoside phosphorylase [Candidatus Sumerlaeia bacterium]